MSLITDCATLFTHGQLTGKRVAAMRLEPTATAAWAVFAIDGYALAFFHDAVAALDWFRGCESRTEDAWQWDLEHYTKEPHHERTDDELVEEYRVEIAARLWQLGFLERWELAS